MSVTGAFLRKEATILRRDPTFVIFLFALPVLLTALLSESLAAAPEVERGVDQALPGFTVMFGFYVIAFFGASHFREHAWGAWTLVRVSGLGRLSLAVNVLLPYWILSVAQMLTLFGFGHLFLDARIDGSLPGLVLLAAATAAVAMGIALVLVNVSGHLSRMQNVTQIVVLGLGAISGAVVPVEMLPGWAGAAAPLTPQYWALEGLRGVMQGATLTEILPELAVLGATAATLLAVGAAGFDPGKSRRTALL